MASLAALEVASLVVGGVATAGSLFEQQQAEQAQIGQFRLQQTQLRIAETTRSSARIDRLQSVFGSQLAQEVARGISPASGSFKAIQQKSFNAFEDDQRADALNLSFKENALNSQIDATRSAFIGHVFGEVSNFALSSFNQLNLNNPNNINNPNALSAQKEINRLKSQGRFNPNIPGPLPNF